MKYEAIFLDFDGVLIDTALLKTQAFITLFKDKKEIQEITKYLTNNGLNRIEKIKHIYNHILNEKLTQQTLDMLCLRYTNLTLKASINAPWIKGAQKFLEEHYTQTPLYIVSSIPTGELRLITKKRNMDKYFKDIKGYPPSKNHILKHLLNKNYYEPPKTLYIGDRLSDLKAAREAGINFIGVTKNFPSDVKTISDFDEI